MKVQIDTTNKVVKVEATANLQELFTFLKRVLEDDFTQYKLEANTPIINWSNPIYVPYKKDPYWYDKMYNATTGYPLPNVKLTTENNNTLNIKNYDIN